MNPSWVDGALRETRVARLATLGADGAVRLVPICFAVVGASIVSAVDHKPKRTGQLRRLDDITATGSATLLLDHYEEDWTQLWWVRIRGAASVVADGSPDAAIALDALVAKYEQYRAIAPRGPVYQVAMDEIRWWRGDGS